MVLKRSNAARGSRSAFTLIELVVVIVVLGVLSGVAIPKYFNMRDKARISAASANRVRLTEAVNSYRLHSGMTGAGAWPATLDLVLDTSQGDEFMNPFRLQNQPVYLPDPDNNVNKWNPLVKTVEERMQSQYKGCIWYNNLNGSLRFCVAQQPTEAESLALFNTVNGTDLTSMSQTSR